MATKSTESAKQMHTKIKEQLAAIHAEMDKPTKDINKLRLASQLMALTADLQNVEGLPLEVFEVLSDESRLIALQGFLFVILSTVDSK